LNLSVIGSKLSFRFPHEFVDPSFSSSPGAPSPGNTFPPPPDPVREFPSGHSGTRCAVSSMCPPHPCYTSMSYSPVVASNCNAVASPIGAPVHLEHTGRNTDFGVTSILHSCLLPNSPQTDRFAIRRGALGASHPHKQQARCTAAYKRLGGSFAINFTTSFGTILALWSMVSGSISRANCCRTYFIADGSLASSPSVICRRVSTSTAAFWRIDQFLIAWMKTVARWPAGAASRLLIGMPIAGWLAG
jgi:hypothetical protein